MKFAVVGVSRILLALVVLIALMVGVVAWWFAFGIRPFDRLNGKVRAMIKTDPDQALAMYPQVFAQLDKDKMSVEDYGIAYSQYAHFVKTHRRYQEAIESLRKSIAHSEKGWRGITKANAILEIAECQEEQELEGGAKLTRADLDALLPAASLHPSRESGDDKWFWPSYDMTLGQMYVSIGDNKNGISYLEKAGEDYIQAEAPWAALGTKAAIVRALVRAGQYAEANRKFIQFCSEMKDSDSAFALRSAFREGLIKAEDKGFDLSQKVLPMLKAKQFAELDKLEDQLLASKRILASGRWDFQNLYVALDAMNDANFDVDWQAHIGLLKEWVAARPQSATAKMALAVVLNGYAWKARGSGYGDTVSEQGWKLFNERLEESMKILDQIKDRPAEWYVPAQTCALGQGWERKRYDAMVEECLNRYPDFDPVIISKCYFLLPRWHGEEGEAESYLASQAAKRKGAAGDLLYARTAWGLDTRIDNIMNQTKLSWPRVKVGMKEAIKQYPKSLVAKGELSILALEAGDVKTAESAFQ